MISRKLLIIFLLVGLLASLQTYAFAKKGGLPKYKLTRPYVTKNGQFRSSGFRDASNNGYLFDNASKIGLNNKK